MRPVVFSALCLLLAWTSPPRAFAQEAVSLFRSGVSLVRVDAEVLDAQGAILPGLQKDDFEVFDQGIPRPLTACSFEEEPLDLILLFDLSGAMRSRLLGVVRAVELGFHELKEGDRVGVFAFHASAFEVAPFTSDLETVNQTIALRLPSLAFGGSSNLEQAVRAVARRFQREPAAHRRRAVLVITDKTSPPPPGPQAAVRELWQANAVLGELVIGRSTATRILEKGAGEIANQTGGPTVVAGDPGPAFQRALRLLRRRYTLYYAAPESQPGSERTIAVRLSGAAASRFAGARLRSRTGYVTGSP